MCTKILPCSKETNRVVWLQIMFIHKYYFEKWHLIHDILNTICCSRSGEDKVITHLSVTWISIEEANETVE